MHAANRPTVMIADSYEDTRSLLKFWLEEEGCRVVEAANGQEAFELSCKQCPDLILMSLRMPILDGLKATQRIRERGQECVFPIVAMSAYPTKEVQASALTAGCVSFVAQPIDFDFLRNLLNSLLPVSAHHQSQEMVGA